MIKNKFRYDINGLRAYAVALVVLLQLHLKKTWVVYLKDLCGLVRISILSSITILLMIKLQSWQMIELDNLHQNIIMSYFLRERIYILQQI